MTKDPVCGMMVDPETAPAKTEYQHRPHLHSRVEEAEF